MVNIAKAEQNAPAITTKHKTKRSCVRGCRVPQSLETDGLQTQNHTIIQIQYKQINNKQKKYNTKCGQKQVKKNKAQCSYLLSGAKVRENTCTVTRRRVLPQYATAAPKT